MGTVIIKMFEDSYNLDLIFVDASHEYQNVIKDLNNYSNLLSNDGILVAHDIHSLEYPGVNKAWNEFKKINNFSFKEISFKKYFFSCGYGLVLKK